MSSILEHDQRGLLAMSWAVRGVSFGWVNWCVALAGGGTAARVGLDAGVSELVTWSQAWAAQGAVYAGTFLGFLLTGFTFLATLGQRKLFVRMAQERNPRHPEVTWLQYCFYSFMRVMAIHFLLLVLNLGSLLLGGTDGGLSQLARSHAWNEAAVYWPLYGFYVMQAFLLGFCVMSLRTFMVDMYRTVMLTLKWAVVDREVDPDCVERADSDRTAPDDGQPGQ